MYLIYAIGFLITFIAATFVLRYKPEWEASMLVLFYSAFWPGVLIIAAFALVGRVIFAIFQFFHRLIRSFIE